MEMGMGMGMGMVIGMGEMSVMVWEIAYLPNWSSFNRYPVVWSK